MSNAAERDEWLRELTIISQTEAMNKAARLALREIQEQADRRKIEDPQNWSSQHVAVDFQPDRIPRFECIVPKEQRRDPRNIRVQAQERVRVAFLEYHQKKEQEAAERKEQEARDAQRRASLKRRPSTQLKCGPPAKLTPLQRCQSTSLIPAPGPGRSVVVVKKTVTNGGEVHAVPTVIPGRMIAIPACTTPTKARPLVKSTPVSETPRGKGIPVAVPNAPAANRVKPTPFLRPTIGPAQCRVATPLGRSISVADPQAPGLNRVVRIRGDNPQVQPPRCGLTDKPTQQFPLRTGPGSSLVQKPGMQPQAGHSRLVRRPSQPAVTLQQPRAGPSALTRKPSSSIVPPPEPKAGPSRIARISSTLTASPQQPKAGPSGTARRPSTSTVQTQEPGPSGIPRKAPVSRLPQPISRPSTSGIPVKKASPKKASPRKESPKKASPKKGGVTKQMLKKGAGGKK